MTETSPRTHDKAATTQATINGLQAIDEQIIATNGGEPGSGLYNLLNMLAGQFLGVPRAAMPTPKAPPPLGRQGSPVADPTASAETEGEVEATEDDDDKSPAKHKPRHR
jgi:hypothetical protein